jgi:hypothetical protein
VIFGAKNLAVNDADCDIAMEFEERIMDIEVGAVSSTLRVSKISNVLEGSPRTPRSSRSL